MVGQPDELETLVEVDPQRAQPVDGDPAGDRAVVADGVADRLQHLQPDPRPVGQRPAVGVGAAVVVGREELTQQVGVAAVGVDDVEPGVPRPARPPAPSRRPAAAGRTGSSPWARRRWRSRWRAARGRPTPAATRSSRPARPVWPSSIPASAPSRVGLVAHHREHLHVVVVPQPRRDVGRLVRLGVDGAVLGADRCPAALRLDGAVAGLRPRLLDAEPRAVRHLVEAVAQRLRADLHRLEQDVVTRVPRSSRRDGTGPKLGRAEGADDLLVDLGAAVPRTPGRPTRRPCARRRRSARTSRRGCRPRPAGRSHPSRCRSAGAPGDPARALPPRRARPPPAPRPPGPSARERWPSCSCPGTVRRPLARDAAAPRSRTATAQPTLRVRGTAPPSAHRCPDTPDRCGLRGWSRRARTAAPNAPWPTPPASHPAR